MSRVDRRLVSIMLSAVILSSLLVFTFVKPRGEASILVLTNRHPEVIVKKAASKGIDSEFSVTLMATVPFDVLELKFYTLFERTLPPNLTNPESLEEIPRVSMMVKIAKDLGWEPEVIETEGQLGDETYDLYVMDFSDLLATFNNASMLSAVPLVFALVRNASSVRYLEGYAGFFPEANRTLEYISISRGEKKWEQYRRRVPRETGLKIGGLPLDGRIIFENVSRDEQVSVTFDVDIPDECLPEVVEWSSQVLAMEVVIVKGDGDIATVIADLARRGVER